MTTRERLNQIDQYVSRWKADVDQVLMTRPELLPDLLPIPPEEVFALHRKYVEARNKAYESVEGLGAPPIILGGLVLIGIMATAAILVYIILYFYNELDKRNLTRELLGHPNPKVQEATALAAIAAMGGAGLPWYLTWGEHALAGYGAFKLVKEGVKL